jgi:hypothetical protein
MSFYIASPHAAFAACTSPAGTEGEFIYSVDYKVLQFCDGTNWIGMFGGASGGGGSVTDGDKGDVSVSGSGATWTVDTESISYAKIQNVSAANKILGRATTGAGVVEEITLGSGLTLTGSTLSASGSSSGAAGYIQFSGGSGVFASSSTTAGQQFFWDETNHRLGIGIAAPTEAVDVVGKVTTDGMIMKPRTGFPAPTGGMALGWSTDGTHVWRATGSVGVGTPSPQTLFQVEGTQNYTGTTPAPADFAANIGSGTSGKVGIGQYNGQPALQGMGTGTSYALYLNPAAGKVVLALGGGNVGIGRTPTTSKLEIAGDVQLLDDLHPAVYYTESDNSDLTWTTVADARAWSLRLNNTSPYPILVQEDKDVIFNAANVGIGTTSPVAKLSVVGAAVGWPATSGTTQTGIAARFQQTASALALDIGGNSGSGAWLQATNSDDLSLEYPLILNPNGGAVGIGTASPGTKLHLAGGMFTIDHTAPYIKMIDQDGGAVIQMGSATGTFLLSNVTASTDMMSVGSTGNLVIFGSSAQKASGTAWVNPSDARLKNIDGPYEHGLNEIAKLDTVRFHFKPDNVRHLPSDKEIVGMIAQDVQKVFPEAVTMERDGYLTLDTSPINFAVINAIKELKADNDNLRAEFEAYKAAHP